MLSLHFFTQSSSFSTFYHPISHNNSKIVAAKLSGKQKSQFISNSSPQNTESSTTSSSSVLSLLCPLLKFLSSPDPSQERNKLVEVATSSLSTLARFPWGSTSIYQSSSDSEIAATANHPPLRLQLYEFEACPFCRRVREAMTELDLSVEVYPCPKGSRRHREIVKQLGGKEQYPFLLDPNNGVLMYESGDIVKYLFEKYGQGRSPSVGLLESTLFTGWVPTILRAGRGMSLWEKSRNEPPPKKLELFSYETNPYARIVREALCELELPYILHNVGNGSLRSMLLLQMSGSKEVPYLIDPNNDKQLGDYTEIRIYSRHIRQPHEFHHPHLCVFSTDYAYKFHHPHLCVFATEQ